MKLIRPIHSACLALVMCCAALSLAVATLQAASFAEFIDPNPAPGNGFGTTVLALSTGNVVITSPYDDAGGADAGAVYLFNGSTGALISTLRGSTANDQIGFNGVIALRNGNYVVQSPLWSNSRGAATWGSGTTGASGIVSAANSLVGSTAGDGVPSGGVTPLANGNYVVLNVSLFNGSGAATWGNGTTGVSGTISATNSLVGTGAISEGAAREVTALPDGNYVVNSPLWSDSRGAATWGSGTAGVSGPISAANSLVGSTAGDRVGDAVRALTNGNYVVRSANWDNGAIVDAGAVTWGSGTTGVSGTVSAANSLVGSTANNRVGSGDVTPLTNGNYVVSSPLWDNGPIVDAGAATWGNGATGTSGTVSPANSLVGSTANDRVSFNLGVKALANGNYVVFSWSWDNGPIADAGAATWGSGSTGVSGTISAANSLVGSTAGDQVGSSVRALTNGNYVVLSGTWDNGPIVDAGAATWGSGTTGVSGTVSAANSLVGSTAGDQVGINGIFPLTNGNYVALSLSWHNGPIVDAGAATWGSGTTGVTGAVSATNSLVGTSSRDLGNLGAVLPNGNYVIGSPNWDNGAIANAGAVTWGDGATGVSGAISATNSLVGSTANDNVGNTGITALANGNYVVRSQLWDNGAVTNAGAATWCSGTSGVTGPVSAANSLVGSAAGDSVGNRMTALANGDYVVTSRSWDNGATANVGAATWGSGGAGVVGTISSANSLIGSTANTNLQQAAVDDRVNDSFISQFLAEGGGRVRVGPTNTPVLMSAVDVPSDQGGSLELTFLRSSQDDASRTPPVATYEVWRKVPGSSPARAARDEAAYAVAPAAAFPAGTWVQVASVPAAQQGQYVVAVPTVSNAAPNDFLVKAQTTAPEFWVRSNVLSGQSTDNLAPAEPTGLTGDYSSGQTNLLWSANTEPDLGSYRLYRGASADFTPSLANRIATPTGTSYADVGPAGSYYKLSAVDVNDNESSFALVTPDGTTGVDAGLPVFALEGVRPNPSKGDGLRVAFALANGSPAWLELLDVGGRRVRSRAVGSLGAGRHEVDLAEGHAIQAGVYWVRLTQGVQQEKLRVAVIE